MSEPIIRYADGREWHINCGARNPWAKGYAICEEGGPVDAGGGPGVARSTGVALGSTGALEGAQNRRESTGGTK